MRTLLKPMAKPIRALSFDPFRNLIAVGCGGDVFIYSQSSAGEGDWWECVEHLRAPRIDHHGLVTALCFFGSSHVQRHLFVGHAMAGFWYAPPPSSSCTIFTYLLFQYLEVPS